MNRFFYFKVTFLSISAGLFAGALVFGLFDVDFSNSEALTKLLLKSFIVAVITGLIMGLLNMYFKIGNFQNESLGRNSHTIANEKSASSSARTE